MGKPSGPVALSGCKSQTATLTLSSVTSLVTELFVSVSITLGMCFRNSSGFALLSTTHKRVLKRLKTSFLISSCPFISCPSSPIIFSILFFIILVLAKLWKKEVFLSTACIQSCLDFSVHVSSSCLLFL